MFLNKTLVLIICFAVRKVKVDNCNVLNWSPWKVEAMGAGGGRGGGRYMADLFLVQVWGSSKLSAKPSLLLVNADHD